MKVIVSVIIPLAPGEVLFPILRKQLLLLPKDWEVLLCSQHKPKLEQAGGERFRWINTDTGRAGCLNEGARQARGIYLWFLHADSIMGKGSITGLTDMIASEEKNRSRHSLYYFDLKLISSVRRFTRPKELGVLFRSSCLHTPFGDQGFFMNKELFYHYGPYSEEASYGEDHLLVRKFRREKITIKPIGRYLYTSARKYDENGWTKTTLSHLYLWLKQVYEDRVEHGRIKKHENSCCRILQNTGTFSGKNTSESPYRESLC